jgi:hypothetical protein
MEQKQKERRRILKKYRQTFYKRLSKLTETKSFGRGIIPFRARQAKETEEPKTPADDSVRTIKLKLSRKPSPKHSPWQSNYVLTM